MKRLLVLGLVAPLVLVSACTTYEREARTGESTLNEEILEFRGEAEDELEEVKRGLDDLESSLFQTGAEVSASIRTMLDGLYRRHDKLRTDLDQLHALEAETFRKERDVLTARLRDLRTALDSALLNSAASRPEIHQVASVETAFADSEEFGR